MCPKITILFVNKLYSIVITCNSHYLTADYVVIFHYVSVLIKLDIIKKFKCELLLNTCINVARMPVSPAVSAVCDQFVLSLL
jgi:hypothetical protein